MTLRLVQRLVIMIAVTASPSAADILVPVNTIRAGDIVYAEDFKIREVAGTELVFDPSDIIGMEARRVLYAGRPIRRSDFGPPALIERNQIVTLVYRTNSLIIETEGRAMGRGGVGDVLRVINLASRTTVTGRVGANGAVMVNQ